MAKISSYKLIKFAKQIYIWNEEITMLQTIILIPYNNKIMYSKYILNFNLKIHFPENSSLTISFSEKDSSYTLFSIFFRKSVTVLV